MTKFIKKFAVGSYKLANKKWISAGALYSGNSTINQQLLSVPNKYFDTKEEADRYFYNYCIKNGYIPVKKD